MSIVSVIDEKDDDDEDGLPGIRECSELEGGRDALILKLAVGSVIAGWTEANGRGAVRVGCISRPEL